MRRRGVILALLIGLAACGGGGGGDDGAAADAADAVDAAATDGSEASDSEIDPDLASDVVADLAAISEAVEIAGAQCGADPWSEACSMAVAGLHAADDRARSITPRIEGLDLPPSLTATQPRIDAVAWTAATLLDCTENCTEQISDLSIALNDLAALSDAWAVYED